METDHTCTESGIMCHSQVHFSGETHAKRRWEIHFKAKAVTDSKINLKNKPYKLWQPV